MAEMTTQGGGAGPNQQTRTVVIVGSVIIVALVGVIVALALNLNRGVAPVSSEEELPPQRSVVVNEDNLDEVLNEIERAEPVQVGYYEARMSTIWTFPNGDSVSPDAYVENVPNNTHDVYFDVLLGDAEETIYESPVIPRGAHLDNIKLDRSLAAGSYDAVIVYHLVDEQQRTISTLRMAITLVVES